VIEVEVADGSPEVSPLAQMEQGSQENIAGHRHRSLSSDHKLSTATSTSTASP
jgi:hypothetical protein